MTFRTSYYSGKYWLNLGLIILPIFAIAFYVVRLPAQQADRGRWVGHTHEVITQLDVIAHQLDEAQIAYYQSGKRPVFLSDAAFAHELAGLQKLVADNRLQESRLASLQQSLAKNMDGIKPAHAVIASMRADEQQLLNERAEAWKFAFQKTEMIVASTQALLLLLVVVNFTLLHRDIKKRTGQVKRAKNDASRLSQIVDMQHRVGQQHLNIDTVIQLIAEQTQMLLGAEGSIIELVEDDYMVYKAAAGTATPHLGLRVSIMGSLSGTSVRENKVLRCDDTENDPRVDRDACRKVGLRSMVVVPLLHKGAPFGVLKVLSSRLAAFSDDDVETLKSLAGFLSAKISDAVSVQNMTSDYQSLTEQKAELQFFNAQLKEMIDMDGLTGLKNQRSFYERLKGEFNRARRYQSPFSLLFIDVDHFKSYNDNFGHVAGDSALKQVATAMKSIARETDFVARYGGEEFALILPETGQDEAVQIADRLRNTIASTAWDLRKVTVSIGLSTYREGVRDMMEMVESADKALYAAKGDGRNCVRREELKQAA